MCTDSDRVASGWHPHTVSDDNLVNDGAPHPPASAHSDCGCETAHLSLHLASNNSVSRLIGGGSFWGAPAAAGLGRAAARRDSPAGDVLQQVAAKASEKPKRRRMSMLPLAPAPLAAKLAAKIALAAKSDATMALAAKMALAAQSGGKAGGSNGAGGIVLAAKMALAAKSGGKAWRHGGKAGGINGAGSIVLRRSLIAESEQRYRSSQCQRYQSVSGSKAGGKAGAAMALAAKMALAAQSGGIALTETWRQSGGKDNLEDVECVLRDRVRGKLQRRAGRAGLAAEAPPQWRRSAGAAPPAEEKGDANSAPGPRHRN
eukprot:gene12342-biopygen21